MSQEAKRLQELLEKKKSVRLSPEEFRELKSLEKTLAKGKNPSDKKSTAKFGEPGNSFDWWNKEMGLLKDGTNILPDWIPGEMLDPAYAPCRLRGVAKYTLLPVYGSAWDSTDPVNLAFRDLFLRMFSKYRGISAYQYPDLAMVCIAGVEITKMICKLERIYGVINRYSKANFNMPDLELRALGISETVAQFIRNHMADYRAELNLMIKKAQRVFVPKDMSILADAISLYGYEYLDHDSAKAQIIIVDSDVFGWLDETSLTTGTCIHFGNVAADFGIVSTADDTITFPALQNMLDRYLGSDSVNKIVGDMAVWFGEDQSITYMEIPDTYICIPAYSEEILHKLHNIQFVGQFNQLRNVLPSGISDADRAEFAGYLEDSPAYFIFQYDNVIRSRLGLVNESGSDDTEYHVLTVFGDEVWIPSGDAPINNQLKAGVAVLDTYRREFSPETVVEGLMYKMGVLDVSPVDYEPNYYNYIINTANFYVGHSITLFKKITTSPYFSTWIGYTNVDSGDTTTKEFAAETSVLDWAPLTLKTSGEIIEKIYGDYDNIKVVDNNTLKRVQTATVLSGIKTDVVVKPSSK